MAQAMAERGGWLRVMFGLVVMAAVALPVSAAFGQPGGPPDPRSRVSLVSRDSGLVPGETAMVGLLFEIDRGWHIYQASQNDTGLPPAVEWSSSAALGFGEIVWPAGHRFTQPGEILDHGYEDRVLLMVPVSVPASVEVGTSVEITGSVEWLACDANLCLPGFADVSLTLPVVSESEAGESAGLFAEAERGLGTPVTGAAGEDVAVSWAGRTLVVTTRHRATLTFVPGPGSARIDGLLGAGVSGDLELRLPVSEDSGDEVSGWVRIQAKPGGTLDTASSLWFVRTRVGELPSESP